MKTKLKFWFYAFALVGATVLLISSCSKDDDDTKSVKDIDGNVYKTVTIGAQVWFAENLRTTRYNDGTNISTGHTFDQWVNLRIDAYAIYPNNMIEGLDSDAEVLEAYGALYNWLAVNTGKLCPTGWHVATDADLTTLTDHAGGISAAGGKLKSIRTAPDAHPRWDNPNTEATDNYGFSALPGGRRYFGTGAFANLGTNGRWWTSTEYDETSAYSRYIAYDAKSVFYLIDNKNNGFSVRCVRDK